MQVCLKINELILNLKNRFSTLNCQKGKTDIIRNEYK